VNQNQWSSGLLSALMACTGGTILVVHSANHLGLNDRQLLSWLFVCYALGGLFNFLMTWRYRLPIAGAHSVTGIAFLSTAAVQLTLPQLAGSFILIGVIIALLGFTGIFQVVFKHIPRPVIDAMLAGVIAHYIVSLIPAFQSNPIVGLCAAVGFFILPKLVKWLPSIVGVIVFGLIGLLFTYSFPAVERLSYELPVLIAPEFTWQGFISIALPVSILIISNDIAVAVAALNKQGYNVPVNRLLIYSGIATGIGGFGLGHSINTGGMMTTVCSSNEAGPKDERYRAALLSSALCILCGIFAWLIIPYIMLLPDYFIASIIGYCLLNIFLNSMQSSFGNKQYRYSVLFAFIISVSGITMLGISAALWSLLVGTVIALLLKEHRPIAATEQAKG